MREFSNAKASLHTARKMYLVIAFFWLSFAVAFSFPATPFAFAARPQGRKIPQQEQLFPLCTLERQLSGRKQRSPSTMVLKSEGESNELSAAPRPSRKGSLGRWRKRLSRFLKGIVLASALTLGPRSKPAEAKFSYEIREERKYSIRPGATREQATQLMDGEVPGDFADSKSVFDEQEMAPSKKKELTMSKSKSKQTFDYGDDDDEDELDFFDDEGGNVVKSPSSPSSISASKKATAEKLHSSTKSSFTGIDTSKTKTRSMYLKVSVGLFIPTWGAMGVREFVRRRKEEAYVKKGLEILEAQKAEYFNSSSISESVVSDVTLKYSAF